MMATRVHASLWHCKLKVTCLKGKASHLQETKFFVYVLAYLELPKISLKWKNVEVFEAFTSKFSCTIFSQISMFLLFFSSVALVKFASKGDNQYVIVGTVKDLVLSPRSCAGGFLHVYMLSGENSESLTFMHKTPVDDVPGYITPFQGRVLVGVGKYLRIYDLGKCKLLRKCENKVNGY